MDYYVNSKKIDEAEALYNTYKYEEAADMAIVLKTYNFTGEDKDRVNDLYNKTIDKAANNVLNRGIELYYAKEYDKAVEKLKKVETYKNDWSRLADAYYFMALSFYGKKDYEKAYLYFDNVVNKFPDSNYSRYSKNYMRIIEESKEKGQQ